MEVAKQICLYVLETLKAVQKQSYLDLLETLKAVQPPSDIPPPPSVQSLVGTLGVIIVAAFLTNVIVGDRLCMLRDCFPLGGVCLYGTDCRSHSRLQEKDGSFLDIIHCVCLRHRRVDLRDWFPLSGGNYFCETLSALRYVYHLSCLLTLQIMVAHPACMMQDAFVNWSMVRGIGLICLLSAGLSTTIPSELVFLVSFVCWSAASFSTTNWSIEVADASTDEIRLVLVILALSVLPAVYMFDCKWTLSWLAVICVPCAIAATCKTPAIAYALQALCIYGLVENGIPDVLCIESLYHGTSPQKASAILKNGGVHDCGEHLHLKAIQGGSTAEAGVQDDTLGKMYFFKDSGFPGFWLIALFARKFMARFHATLTTRAMLKRAFMYELFKHAPYFTFLWELFVDPIAAVLAHFLPLVKLRVPPACVDGKCSGIKIFKNDPAYGELAWFTEAPVSPWTFGLSGAALSMLHPTHWGHILEQWSCFAAKPILGLMELGLAWVLYTSPGLTVNNPVLSLVAGLALPFLL